LDDITSSDLGFSHACGLDASGGVWCWGDGTHGKIGNGSTSGSNPAPVQVLREDGPALEDATAVFTGDYHSCALLGAAADVWCWGYNHAGQVGDGGTNDAVTARPVKRSEEPGDTLSGIKHLALGYDFSCALSQGGQEVWCWGSDEHGQLGNGALSTAQSPYPVPVSLPPGLEISLLEAGYEHACMLSTTGKVYCWGDGSYGQQGAGTTADAQAPFGVPALGSKEILDISCGGGATCAVDADGGVWCWGSNAYGQVGDGATWVMEPTKVIGLDAGCPDGFLDINGDTTDGCEYECEPVGPETCDGVDEDCDGLADETFDFAGDPANCGGCGVSCAETATGPDVSTWACEVETCVVEACETGFFDLNGDPADGCEYACDPAGGEETLCDGKDDDCNGVTDEGWLCQSAEPGTVGACGGVNGCVDENCPTGQWDLDADPANGCEYTCTYKDAVDGCGGIDDDCDGVIDEDAQDCAPSDTYIQEVAVSREFTCARRQDGTVWCWGDNAMGCSAGTVGSFVELGALGPFDGEHSATPIQMPLVSALGSQAPTLDLDANGNMACAVVGDSAEATSGTIWCWGDDHPLELGGNKLAQLGAGVLDGHGCSLTPVQVNHWAT
ncbi:MAG: MopE-related protein, partial [Myxococcota bacterium]|nr:MopE-related protein [Myxococcota bacterium]